MAAGRSLSRSSRGLPRPLLPLLLISLLVLQRIAPATAQTSAAAEEGPMSLWGPEALRLTTSERERLCYEDSVAAAEDSEDSSSADGPSEDNSLRRRRSSEWSPEQQLASISGGGGGGGDSKGGCPITWDGALCWPATVAGTNRSLPCFHEFRGVLYSTDGEYLVHTYVFTLHSE